MSTGSGSGIRSTLNRLSDTGEPTRAEQQIGQARLNAEGQLSLGGEILDYSTPEGTARLLAALNEEDLAKLQATLELELTDGEMGRVFVRSLETPSTPNPLDDDAYNEIDVAALRHKLGPLDTDEGRSDIDQELGLWFEEQGMANPYNANTTPELYDRIGKSVEFQNAVEAMKAALTNPSEKSNVEFFKRMQFLQTAQPHGNVMEVLFLIFRESIKQVNEDKKYFLKKLQDYNKMAEALSDYLSELVEHSRALGSAASGAKYPEMVLTPTAVTIKKFDLSTLDTEGNCEP
ncbi:MAG: hypothetical protein R3C68_02255 [Myxococcota bacterium]